MQKTILITGCSSGVGAAMAREFRQRGHRVFATARRRDSLAALGVIVMWDTDYGMTISGDDPRACITVGDIFAKEEKKKAA